ncbi:hypothetical protein CGJ44_24760 [Vibrio parahaemolyticus]|nr:hypothetical protein CGK43_23945 [Vibrio parahaemolyticus]TOE36340.1 hypothetical protein CGJ44_24760 [Vibrio parahaemolyticus]TOP56728.1 hypothetical protein CGH13_23625 [Vibrio parahaemolyticus]
MGLVVEVACGGIGIACLTLIGRSCSKE